MLSDRDYMRIETVPPRRSQTPRLPTSVVNALIGCNVVVFLFVVFGITNLDALALSNQDSLLGWRAFSIVTHMFAHDGLGHIAMNMWGLYLFGKGVEQILGARRFLILYMVSGLVGSGCFMLMNYWSNTPVSLVGASGCVFGVLAAAMVLYPNQEVILLIPPIPMKMRTFCFVYLGIEMAFLLLNTSDGVAHLAHLGGFAGGYLLTRFLTRDALTRRPRTVTRRTSTPPFNPGLRMVPPRNVPERVVATGGLDETVADTDPSLELDTILDKIGKQGMKSLTREEKEVLDRAHERFKKELS